MNAQIMYAFTTAFDEVFIVVPMDRHVFMYLLTCVCIHTHRHRHMHTFLCAEAFA